MNETTAEPKREARVCMKCGRIESGWNYDRCPNCGEMSPQAGAQVPTWATRALNAEARNNALESALRLVLMQSIDFDNSFCRLCQTKDRHAGDCVSKVANEALAFWGAHIELPK